MKLPNEFPLIQLETKVFLTVKDCDSGINSWISKAMLKLTALKFY